MKATPTRIDALASNPNLGTLIFGLLFTSSFALLMWEAWRPLESLLEGRLVDDFFYYLQVIWNWVEVGSLSLDGRNPTNGFHPLFAALLIPLKWIAGDDKVLFMKLALSLLIVAHLLTAVFLVASFRRLIPNRTLALVPAFIWLTWPATQAFPLMGMESSLLSAGIALTLWAYLCLDGGIARDVALGAAITVAALARLDALLLAPILSLFAIYPTLASEGSWQSRLARASSRLLALNSVVLVVVGSYLAANVATFGHAVPISGRVKTVRTLGSDWQADQSITERIHRVAEINLFERTKRNDQVYKNRTLFMTLLGVMELAAIWAARSRVSGWMARALAGVSFESMRPLLLYGIGVHFYYILIQGYFHSTWYLLHSSLILAIYASIWLCRLAVVVRIPEPGFVAAGVAIPAIALAVGFDSEPSSGATVKTTRFAYDVALELNETLPDGSRLGACNAGTLAYFSRFPVTNLDGLINNAAGEAILEHRLGRFIEEEKLDYLADWGGSIRFSNVFARDNYVKRLYRAVANFGNPTGWTNGGDFYVLERVANIEERVAIQQ
jgi:hypothetical protein